MKNIIIQEGGINKTLNNIKKIQTAKSGSNDDIYWIPEDEAKLGEKTISKNGTYKAEDDNLYGYSKVIVKGVGKASGVKPGSGTPPSQGGNGNDNEYSAEKDDDTGELVEKVLPSSIKVTTPPTKTTYQNGETIDTTGMVVTGYKNDGTVWSEDPNYPNGIIPLSEITIEPTVAEGGSGESEYSDGDGVNAVLLEIKEVACTWPSYIYILQPSIATLSESGEISNYSRGSENSGNLGKKVYGTVFNGNTYYKGVDLDGTFKCNGYRETSGNIWTLRMGSTSNITNDWGYLAEGSFKPNLTFHLPVSTKDPTQAGELHPVGGNQEISVNWNRIEDEQELSDTFNITVNN